MTGTKTNKETTAQGVKSTAGLDNFWTKEKPDFACVFLTRHKIVTKKDEYFDYNLWRFDWEPGESPEDSSDDNENVIYYYLAWTDGDGDEWDDISECDYDEYLILEILPTLEEKSV